MKRNVVDEVVYTIPTGHRCLSKISLDIFGVWGLKLEFLLVTLENAVHKQY